MDYEKSPPALGKIYDVFLSMRSTSYPWFWEILTNVKNIIFGVVYVIKGCNGYQRLNFCIERWSFYLSF